jgi:large subunit ribosomal protein L24
MKIKTGDNVAIIHGKDRGKTGTVLQILTDKKTGKKKIVVEGVNKLKKHLRARGGEKGRVIELPAPFDISNAMVIDSKTNRPTRVGYSLDGDKKTRVSKTSNTPIA